MKEKPMSKFIHGCFALVLILVFSTPATCKELTTYMSCNAGATLVGDSNLSDSTSTDTVSYEFDPGYFVGVAFGNEVDKIRFEAEIGIQKSKVDSITTNGIADPFDDNREIRLTTLMFNLYYDFLKGSRFTPYLSAGLGLGNMKLDKVSGSDAVAEYQIGAGMAFRISDRVVLDLKGRYMETTKAEFDTSNLDFSTINGIFDVRIYF
jgi:opacity protein-like surface antigen